MTTARAKAGFEVEYTATSFPEALDLALGTQAELDELLDPMAGRTVKTSNPG